ncbi:DinB family protein [Flavitalea sp.]|nr:DinB family protein [Flavitalea sp.]
MKDFFKELFDYGHSVNQQLAEIFTLNRERTSEKSVKLFNHILNAHQIWNSRIEPGQTPFEVWADHPIEKCKLIDNSNYENTLIILEKYDINNRIDYKRRGQAASNSIRDILFQVINHSTYHRGQIATEFRLKGIEPLVSDYILYKQ